MRILAVTALALALSACGASKGAVHDRRATVHTVAKPAQTASTGDCWSTHGSLAVHIYGAGARACAAWDRERSSATVHWKESPPPRSQEATACSLQNGSYLIRVVAEDTSTHASADLICTELARRGWKPSTLND